MAAASGLALVKPEFRNPMLTTSRGTGELIKAALDRGVLQPLFVSALKLENSGSENQKITSDVQHSVGMAYSCSSTMLATRMTEFLLLYNKDMKPQLAAYFDKALTEIFAEGKIHILMLPQLGIFYCTPGCLLR